MDADTKKVALIVVVVVCIVAAGAITYFTGSGQTAGTTGGTMMWVKCNNPNCGHEYQIDKIVYREFVDTEGGRMAAMYGAPPMKCEKCGENSVFAAIKCEKCGKVFFPGTVEGESEDKCPECGFSKNEEMKKALQ